MNKSKRIFNRYYIYNTVVVLLLALLPQLTSAQDSNLGNWMIYIGNKKINSKWNIHHEVQHRNYDAIADLEQLLLRTGVGYNLADNTNLLLGYGFIHSENYINASDEKENVDEHRIFQQLISKSKIGIVGLQHRYRFEQRFVSDDFKMRFRYFLGLSIPLKIKENTNLYLSGYNEIFLNSKADVFDRNRTYMGLGYKLNQALRL
jgi:hypothetical protein